MSVGESPKIGSDKYAWAGLASATKPPSAFVGQKAIETDTGDEYDGINGIVSGFPFFFDGGHY